MPSWKTSIQGGDGRDRVIAADCKRPLPGEAKICVNGGNGGAKRTLIDCGTYVGFQAQAKFAGTAEMGAQSCRQRKPEVKRKSAGSISVLRIQRGCLGKHCLPESKRFDS
jgi:hypothetical protein